MIDLQADLGPPFSRVIRVLFEGKEVSGEPKLFASPPTPLVFWRYPEITK